MYTRINNNRARSIEKKIALLIHKICIHMWKLSKHKTEKIGNGRYGRAIVAVFNLDVRKPSRRPSTACRRARPGPTAGGARNVLFVYIYSLGRGRRATAVEICIGVTYLEARGRTRNGGVGRGSLNIFIYIYMGRRLCYTRWMLLGITF